MRIAILTFHRAVNCGAMLQAWALKTVLERMGHTVEFPCCNYVGDPSRLHILDVSPDLCGLDWIKDFLLSAYCDLKLRGRVGQNVFHEFRRKHFAERKCEPEDFSKYYDYVIIGSDQVWNPVVAGKWKSVFDGSRITPTVPVMAYAISCGDDVNQARISELIPKLKRFVAVSTREELLAKMLSNKSERFVDSVLDPTLLLRECDYSRLIPTAPSTDQYLYLYTLIATPFVIDFARRVARRLNLRLVVTQGAHEPHPPKREGFDYETGPCEMLSYIANAKYVLAASFHGTALSLIFKKKFLSLRSQIDRIPSRPEQLLRAVGCGSHLVNPSIDFEDALRRLDEVVDKQEVLSEMAVHSIEWIRSNLSKNSFEEKCR